MFYQIFLPPQVKRCAIAQSPPQNENFANTSKNPLKSRKQPHPPPAVPRPTRKPELAPNILQIIVART